MNQPVKPINVYARGLEDGAVMGPLLIAVFAAMVLSLSYLWVNMVLLVLIVAVPVVCYMRLRRSLRSTDGRATFSMLWMEGIMMFLGASMFFGAASFVFLRWIQPGFVMDMLRAAYDTYSAMPGENASALADELQMIISSGVVPSAAGVASGWMWLTMFTGSVLSALVALLLKARFRAPRTV